jgi:hypothetical protein
MRTTMILGFLALSGTACTDIGSGSLLTSGMSAAIVGEADGSGSTEVSVVLKAGGVVSNTFVDLEGDDELTVSAGELTETCTARTLGVLHSYVATLPVDAEGTEFTVALTRTVDDGAPNSTFTLPAPIEDADFGTTLSSTQDLTLNWSPVTGTDEMEVIATGECIVAYGKELDGDPGSTVIPFDDVDVLGDEPGVSCQIDVTLRRVRGGQVDPAFGEGGIAQGRQIITSTVQYSSGE